MDLSTRQLEVCELIATGKTESETAAALGISVHTVKAHKSIAYRKLGVRNAVEMANRMRERND